MIIYFASSHREEKGFPALEKLMCEKRLLSYFYYTEKDDRYYRKNKNIILDSGAFSAHNSGAEIDLNTYIAFLKERPNIRFYFNLDVIGNAEATWKNQKIMESAGLNPLPVYHYGEDKKYLFKCLDYEYFGLGGMVGRKQRALQLWLDRVFDSLKYDRDGKICNKIHGLGMTSWELMRRYPWYSVDSTGWLIASAMGSIYLPKFKGNKWDFSKKPRVIRVSNSNKNLNYINSYLNYIQLSVGENILKKHPLDYKIKEEERKIKENKEYQVIETVLEEGVKNSYRHRWVANCRFINEFEKTIPEFPGKFAVRRKKLF